MIRIGILGDIGSGKSFVAKNFGYPVFNADYEVSKLYEKNKNVYQKFKKILPEYIYEFPIDKIQLSKAILANNSNLKKIIKIVHKEIRNKLQSFLIKNKKKRFVILDIPLLLENKINKKKDILVYVESDKIDILRNLKKRKNFNVKILNKFKKIQLPLAYKKRNSRFIIKNKFTQKSVKDGVNKILKIIKDERSSSRY
ncbi:dephospho-CoA kinase [Pelagibacterales bacterium SAG-MED08]|jgi:dephospho-CoA kinase|nr:dephospho-CoA kinase [Pelagibacterales bacterium SAG-MED08]|tara:strand:- start:270 stop:863 length:594 start_codon:yes stop_codon:yes gene_type:complete